MEMRRTRGSSRARLSAVIVWFAIVALAAQAEACPGCKEALFDPTQVQRQRATASGYAASIGMLLLVPAGLVAGVGTVAWRGQRRKQRLGTASGRVDTAGLSR
jgi:hypothetical protein